MSKEDLKGFVEESFRLFSPTEDTCTDVRYGEHSEKLSSAVLILQSRIHQMIFTLNFNPTTKQMRDLISEMLEAKVELDLDDDLFSSVTSTNHVGEGESEINDENNLFFDQNDGRKETPDVSVHISQYVSVMTRVISENEIPRENIAKIRRAFCTLDQNRSDFLNTESFISILEQEGESFSQAESMKLRRKLRGYGKEKFAFDDLVEELAIY